VTKPYFYAFLECCAVNACNFYRHDIDPNITQLQFLTMLIEELGVPHLVSPGPKRASLKAILQHDAHSQRHCDEDPERVPSL